VGRTTILPGGPLEHGILIAPLTRAFEELAVAASLWLDSGWLAIHEHPNLLSFEMEHGALEGRWVYNARCIARARRTGATVIGQHKGFYDLFVPVPGDPVRAVVVSGPFAKTRPTSTDLLERWRSLTGRQGHPSDPEFSYYLSVALTTLVLDAKRRSQFQRLLERLTALMISEGSISQMVRDIASLTNELQEVRFVERVWDVAHEMVDKRTSRVWSRPYRRDRRQMVGLLRFPDHVIVGLFVHRRRNADPVAELLRNDAFQRACVGLARDAGDVVSGRIGNHGVTFLCADRGTTLRARRRRLLDIGQKATALARSRFGLDLHVGVSTLSLPLPAQFQAALAAAESALSKGLHLVQAEVVRPTGNPLRQLRRDLARLAEVTPVALPARFDRYVAAVAAHFGYQLEPCRAHLDAALESMTEALVGGGTLDDKSIEAVDESVRRAVAASHTMDELFAAYRRAVADIVSAVGQPTAARHDRSLRRAIEFLRQHYAERPTLKQVARVAGFAPNYFSQLFHQAQRMTFANYLVQLRLQRAQELLAGTSLSLDRVAQLSGLVRRQHLIRVLKRSMGETPMQYRRRMIQGGQEPDRP